MTIITTESVTTNRFFTVRPISKHIPECCLNYVLVQYLTLFTKVSLTRFLVKRPKIISLLYAKDRLSYSQLMEELGIVSELRILNSKVVCSTFFRAIA